MQDSGDIWKNILDYIHPIDFRKVMSLSKIITQQIDKNLWISLYKTYRLSKASEILKNDKDMELIRQLLIRLGGLMIGGRVLQSILNKDWSDTNIHIFFFKNQMGYEKFQDLMDEKGITYNQAGWNTKKHIKFMRYEISNNDNDFNQYNSKLLSIYCVTQNDNNNHFSDYVTENFDLSVTQCWWDGINVYCNHFFETLSKRGIAYGKDSIHQDTREYRKLKYTLRGFHMSEKKKMSIEGCEKDVEFIQVCLS
jgi:hypothetical protein